MCPTIGHGTIKTSSSMSSALARSVTTSTSSTSSHPSGLMLLVLMLVLLIGRWRLIRRGRGWWRIICRCIQWRKDKDIVIRQLAVHMVHYGLHLMHLSDELRDYFLTLRYLTDDVGHFICNFSVCNIGFFSDRLYSFDDTLNEMHIALFYGSFFQCRVGCFAILVVGSAEVDFESYPCFVCCLQSIPSFNFFFQ